MSDPVGLTTGPPETRMADPDPGAVRALDEARSAAADAQRAALGEVAKAYPEWPDVWAALGAQASDDIEAYAYFRVGYHRGLDALRKAGWRGSGYVRWSVPSNRGFLRCLDGLRAAAQSIGEQEESERCRLFLHQLDPAWSERAQSERSEEGRSGAST